MKKNIIILFLLAVNLIGCGVFDSRKREYMNRHSYNFDVGHTISRSNNPNLPGDAEVYDAEDYRAGAMEVCNLMKETYDKDLCAEVNYWGLWGPRIKPITE